MKYQFANQCFIFTDGNLHIIDLSPLEDTFSNLTSLLNLKIIYFLQKIALWGNNQEPFPRVAARKFLEGGSKSTKMLGTMVGWQHNGWVKQRLKK